MLDIDLPSGLPWHSATKEQLCSCAPLQGFPTGSIVLFTDGSFDGECSSWAFVAVRCTAQGARVEGWARGRVAIGTQPRSIGATRHSAIEAERSAMFWAIAWALQMPWQDVAFVQGDNLTALGQAAGRCGGHDRSVSGFAIRAVAQAAEAHGKLRSGDISHVKAHAGHAYNELVDILAKARHLPDSDIPSSIGDLVNWIGDGSIEWLWVLISAIRSPEQWPLPFPLPSIAFLNLPEPAQPAFFAKAAPSLLHLRLVTANVQTLEEQPAEGILGRVPYVREQLAWLGVVLTGLQETRARETATITSTTHLRFLSAADAKGCLGVELWVSRTVPFAYQGQRPLYFEAQDFRILAWSPRFLITRCQRGSLKLLIVVCHAPTRADKDRDRWWKEFVDKVISIAKGDQVVVLGDLNVRFTAPLVGDLCWETEEEVPVQLLRLLQVLQLWAPSTYTACHTGLSHTWASPGHGILSRLDYVLVPLGWPVLPSASVLHEVDFGQKGIDHFAVQLDVTVAAWDSVAAPRRSKRIDIARLKDTSSSQVVREICDAAPEVPWSVDVHTHCDLVTRHLVDFLAAAFPRDRAPRRRKFFSDTTWNFRQQRTALRRLVHKGIGWFRGFEERWAFTIWRAESGFASTGVKLFATLLGRVKAVAAAIVGLKDLKPLLRRSLCRDKAAYLRGIAQEAARAPGSHVFARLRPLLGPPRRKQRATQSLPAVLLEDGTTAPDAATAEARWIRHFSAIEAGYPEDPLVIVAQCLRRQNEEELGDDLTTAADVPSRTLYEAGLRAAACDRAAGRDCIPPELLHHHAPEISRLTYGLFLKMAFRRTEPLQWKGGELFQVWKRKGSMLACENYRAILVSSCLGKAAHWTFRKKFGPLLDKVAAPMQIGGRAGYPVQLAIHAARLFQESCRH